MPTQANDSASPSPVARKATKRQLSALQDVTNIKSRKRGDALSPSDDSVHHMAKKNKRIEQTTTVTPMTTTGKEKSNFPCYVVDVMSPLAHQAKPIPEAIPLPADVANIYPCDDDKVRVFCSSRSLSHSYLRHYGQLYSQSLRDWEDAYFVKPETGGYCSASSSSSPPSSQEDDGLSHRAMPPRRVNYYVNRRFADDTEQHSTESSVSSQVDKSLEDKEDVSGMPGGDESKRLVACWLTARTDVRDDAVARKAITVKTNGTNPTTLLMHLSKFCTIFQLCH